MSWEVLIVTAGGKRPRAGRERQHVVTCREQVEKGSEQVETKCCEQVVKGCGINRIARCIVICRTIVLKKRESSYMALAANLGDNRMCAY